MIDQLLLKNVFNAYALAFYTQHKRFSFEDFGDFATTLLNYYVNAQRLNFEDKLDAAYYLTQLYNQGMGNRIAEKDVLTIAQVIRNDFSLDLILLQKIQDLSA